jgi:hypothetical protein
MSEWFVVGVERGDPCVVEGPVVDPFAGPFASRDEADVWLDALLSGAYI